MLIKISIPSYRKIEADNDKSYTVSVNCQFEQLGPQAFRSYRLSQRRWLGRREHKKLFVPLPFVLCYLLVGCKQNY